MQRIFISAPTSGVVVDGQLSSQFIERVAKLQQEHPQAVLISPMIMGYPLLPHMNIPATWEFWQGYCKSLINVCDEMWVLTYPGWQESTGVAGEMSYVMGHPRYIPIYFKEV
jgi:hypothetical protein